MADRPPFAVLSQAIWPVVASAFSLLAFLAVGRRFLSSYSLDLGSMNLPGVQHTYFMFFWTILGSLAAALLAVGLTRMQALSRRSAATRHGPSLTACRARQAR